MAMGLMEIAFNKSAFLKRVSGVSIVDQNFPARILTGLQVVDYLAQETNIILLRNTCFKVQKTSFQMT